MGAIKRARDEAASRQGAKPRRNCVRDAVASVRIEGGDVDEDAACILDRWADGTLSDDAMMAEILKPHAAGKPDTLALDLPAEEIAARRDATRGAIASARIEGVEVSAGARAIMELYDQGRIGEDEMIARIRQHCLGRQGGDHA